ncbi:MAG: iron uptake porin, partial [Pseudanabaena sp.]
MKKVSNLSVLLGLSLLATATGANAETQNQVRVQAQSTSVPALQSSLPVTEVKMNESETIRAINTELNRPKELAQNVTSVSQLSDVKPTDWAFTALQSLVERYGCIAGYPDRTFRGKQATSRYEFAAGLNACLDKINEIISAGLADKVSKQDLATLQKLQEEFAAELATLRGRVGGSPSLQATTTTGFVNGQSDIFAANFDWLVTKGFGLFGRYGYGTTN